MVLHVLNVFTPDLTPKFVDRTGPMTEKVTGNLFNQIIWLGLAGLAAVPVLFMPNRLIKIVMTAWPLLLIAGLALASVLWASHPDTAFRRVVQFFVVIFTIASAAAYSRNPRWFVKIVYYGFLVALPLNMATIPTANAYSEHGFFSGIFAQKNGLGAAAAIALLVGWTVRGWMTRASQKWLNLAFLGGWALMLAMSVSKTSIILAIGVPILFYVIRFMSRSMRIPIFASIVLFLMLSGAILGAVVYGASYPFPKVVETIAGDVTFTGRTELWGIVLGYIEQKPLLGYGYGSFWQIGIDSPNLKMRDGWLQGVNQAHNGYLDVIALLGVAGLLLVALLLGWFGMAVQRVRSYDIRLFRLLWWFVLFVLIHNLFESTFIRAYSTVWIVLLIAVFLVARTMIDPNTKQSPRPVLS